MELDTMELIAVAEGLRRVKDDPRWPREGAAAATALTQVERELRRRGVTPTVRGTDAATDEREAAAERRAWSAMAEGRG